MSYTSFTYLLLIGGIVLVYYLLPRRMRWLALLAGNLVFYAQAGLDELSVLLCEAVISWGGALRLEHSGTEWKELRRAKEPVRIERRKRLQNSRRKLLFLVLCLLIGTLAVTKYTNFFLRIGFRVLHRRAPILSLVLPLGISFYTFQMIAYLMDVYKGKISAQRNFLQYFLYASFFPTVVQGPIARYRQLGAQLTEGHSIRFENLRDGSIQILWGFAKKLVMAERLGVFVGEVFDHHSRYHGVIFLLAAAVYSVQMYADFSGCMDIASGTARLFGIELAPNFLRPYFSKNMPEFWRRWHASLGSWFRDYVFFPFSISRASQKLNRAARRQFGETAGRTIAAALPILLVWFLTGIWHGAELKYIFWGCFHGGLILCSTIFGPVCQRLGERLSLPLESKGFDLFRMARTFFLCCIGRIFFRSGSVRIALSVLRRMASRPGLSYIRGGRLLTYGLNGKNMAVVICFFLVWFVISLLQERGHQVLGELGALPLPLRWLLIYALLFAVLILGKYGPAYQVSDFIYEQF